MSALQRSAAATVGLVAAGTKTTGSLSPLNILSKRDASTLSAIVSKSKGNGKGSNNVTFQHPASTVARSFASRSSAPSTSSQHRYSYKLSRPSATAQPLSTRPLSLASRILSTAPTSFRSPSTAGLVGLFQHRTLFGTSWGSNSNQNHLANLELTANNNPGSATAQNAFYQALIRQNMPEIIVERHQTGRYASNAAVDAVYNRALEKIGAQEVGGLNLGSIMNNTQPGQSQQMSNEQLQAIGQAVAAKTRGGSVSISSRGTGGKAEPSTLR